MRWRYKHKVRSVHSIAVSDLESIEFRGGPSSGNLIAMLLGVKGFTLRTSKPQNYGLWRGLKYAGQRQFYHQLTPLLKSSLQRALTTG